MGNVNRATVLQGSIEQLERVSALLAHEIDGAAYLDMELPIADRLRKETLLGISVLLPKLRAVRNFSVLQDPPSDVASS